MGTPNNWQETHKHPAAWSPSRPTSPLHIHTQTDTHTHTALLQKNLVPICTNDSPCLMHFLEDGAGYSFGMREGVGEVSGQSAPPYGFPSAHFSRPIFQERGLGPALGPAVMRFITGEVGRSPDCLRSLRAPVQRICTSRKQAPDLVN